MKIALVTDAWHPQVNGVVRTLDTVIRARTIGQRIEAFDADAVHLATEGPLCIQARRWCLRKGRPFTTAYHTQFPEYLAKRTKLSPRIFWPYIRCRSQKFPLRCAAARCLSLARPADPALCRAGGDREEY